MRHFLPAAQARLKFDPRRFGVAQNRLRGKIVHARAAVAGPGVDRRAGLEVDGGKGQLADTVRQPALTVHKPGGKARAHRKAQHPRFPVQDVRSGGRRVPVVAHDNALRAVVPAARRNKSRPRRRNSPLSTAVNRDATRQRGIHNDSGRADPHAVRFWAACAPSGQGAHKRIFMVAEIAVLARLPGITC